MATRLRDAFRVITGGAQALPGASVPAIVEKQPVVAPRQNDNQYDAEGRRSRAAAAKKIFEQHVAGLQARRERDLISQKLLLHIDGSGDFQWVDIFGGTRLAIPRSVSEYRKTENVLRMLVANAVAHHTTMPLRYFAESMPDRRSKEQALINIIWANHLAEIQRLNEVFADALFLAMPAGFCPVHRYWRDDVPTDWYESLYAAQTMGGEAPLFNPQGPGMLDVFVGNPFDHVFDPHARRGSVRWQSYARSIPGDLFRETFGHIPEARTLEGSKKLSSASEFQRIAQAWRLDGIGLHGSPVIENRRENTEDSVTVICKEFAPGVLPDWPDGRLQIIGVGGDVDTLKGYGKAAHAVLVADQNLPGRDFSSSIFYSDHRGTDIHGRPWPENLDELQVDLNVASSRRWEYINKMIDAPLVTPGGAIADDMNDLDGYSILEIDPSMAGWRPAVMEWPQSALQALDKVIEELRRALYTQGGYQAVSRGEAPGSRMAYRAIVALQQADNTVHGPVNVRFRRSACDFMLGCWRQMKAYGDIPWLVDVVGDEYAHLVEPYVDRTKLSDQEPKFKLVNAFGASPELRAQEIVELMQIRGADGQVFLRTDEARRQYPDQMLFDDGDDPGTVMRRRAKTISREIETRATALREQLQLGDLWDPTDQRIQWAATKIFFEMESYYPRLRDDDLMAHLASLSSIVQDETADPIARLAAIRRQDLYFQWQAQMAAQAAPQQLPPGDGGPPAGGTPSSGGAPEKEKGDSSLDPRQIAAEFRGGQAGAA